MSNIEKISKNQNLLEIQKLQKKQCSFLNSTQKIENKRKNAAEFRDFVILTFQINLLIILTTRGEISI